MFITRKTELKCETLDRHETTTLRGFVCFPHVLYIYIYIYTP